MIGPELLDNNEENNGRIRDEAAGNDKDDDATNGGDNGDDNGHHPNNGSVELPRRDSKDNYAALPAHVCNPQIPRWLRFGMPAFIVLIMCALLAGDIGSGVAALTQIEFGTEGSEPSEPILILRASVFTSVKKLWHTGSYALTIFICITSVSWPYLKLLLSLYAWLMPLHRPLRREKLIMAIDAIGKWSLVDIVVFLEIAVVFQSTIPLGGGTTLNVYIVPEWGLFVFVGASIVSLISAHVILYLHRQVIYGDRIELNNSEMESNRRGLRQLANLSLSKAVVLTFLLVTSFAMYLAGCLTDIFVIDNERGTTVLPPEHYSIVRVGNDLPGAALDSKEGGIRWLQILWFLFFVATPLLSHVLFLALLWLPLSQQQLASFCLWTEIGFAWSLAEVVFVSTIFAVLEIPTFGSGLIDSGCETCYVVNSHLTSQLAVLATGTVMHVALCVWLLRIAHRALYGEQ